jgi:hypothetical protein
VSTKEVSPRASTPFTAAHGVQNVNFHGQPTEHTDFAAAERMKDMIADPRLREVRAAVQIAMRRLYRARNVVLHGGSTSSGR